MLHRFPGVVTNPGENFSTTSNADAGKYKSKMIKKRLYF